VSEADVIVVGAGVAGMAAAVRVAQAGRRVLVLETRKKLGGRAGSFIDPRTGEELDNCQHVALACCTAYIELLRALGSEGLLAWESRQWWIEPGGRTSVIEPSWLPAPGHYGPSVLRARFLSVTDVAVLARGMGEVLTAARPAWRGRTFGAFLAEAGQSARVLERFWSPVVVSACNLDVGEVDAGVALKVFQEGFLAGRTAAVMGVPRVPLGRLYDGFTPLVERAGGRVRLGASVERVEDGRVRLAGGEQLRASRVVCALPYERAIEVADDARLEGLRAFAGAHSPIVGVHVHLDRPVMDTPHAVLVEGGVQWLFRKDDAGCRVHAVISGARGWVGLEEGAIVERVLADVRRYLPRAQGAGVVFARAIKEKRATFAATPAFERARPAVARAGGGGLLLAGDYCATDWPATMEGASRAGFAAGEAALGG
jgi:squalene-associated FAD-dependent desaturase